MLKLGQSTATINHFSKTAVKERMKIRKQSSSICLGKSSHRATKGYKFVRNINKKSQQNYKYRSSNNPQAVSHKLRVYLLKLCRKAKFILKEERQHRNKSNVHIKLVIQTAWWLRPLASELLVPVSEWPFLCRVCMFSVWLFHANSRSFPNEDACKHSTLTYGLVCMAVLSLCFPAIVAAFPLQMSANLCLLC